MNKTIFTSIWCGIRLIHGIAIRPLKKITHRLSAVFRKVKSNRKLKKSGYRSWSEYAHFNDPFVNQRANNVESFYTGYKYIYKCELDHFAYHMIYNYGPGGARFGIDEIHEWCKKHITFDYRIDYHSIFKSKFGTHEFINDIAGTDAIFIAFKHEKDLMHFILRWT